MNKYIEKIERFPLRMVNKLIYHGQRKPKGIELMSGEELNDYIYQGLMSEAPFMVARFGSIELDAALYPYLVSLPLWKRYQLYTQRMGKKAVHLGGATQILFGIKGKRWDENPAVSKFYNEYWVRPLPEESVRKNNVEGGCYW